ncbi:MAG: helix-turn-helix domain-containing protein [Candidatus Methanomethylicia archaeon]
MENIVNSLIQLGLSRGEAETYLLIIKEYRVSTDFLKLKLGVRSQDVEEILKLLTVKGFIKPVSELSNTYEATEPETAISRLVLNRIKDLEDKISQIRNLGLKIKDDILKTYKEAKYGIRAEQLIQPLASLSEMEIHTFKIISEAERNIDIFTLTFGWYDKVREALISCLERRVTIRVLMKIADETSRRIALELKELGASVKILAEEWHPLRGTIADNKRMVFLIWASKGEKPIYYLPHYSTNEGILEIFKEFFNKKWNEAKPL